MEQIAKALEAIQAQLTQLNGKVEGLREDFKTEVKEIRTELKEIRAEAKETRELTNDALTGLTDAFKKLHAIPGQLTEIRGDMRELRTDMRNERNTSAGQEIRNRMALRGEIADMENRLVTELRTILREEREPAQVLDVGAGVGVRRR